MNDIQVKIEALAGEIAEPQDRVIALGAIRDVADHLISAEGARIHDEIAALKDDIAAKQNRLNGIERLVAPKAARAKRSDAGKPRTPREK